MNNPNFRNDIAGLRGIAIILVVLNHLASKNLQNGYAGVDLFFVLSGYLIIGGMIKAYEQSVINDRENAKLSVASFYIRRTLRLAPAATAVTLVTVILTVILFNSVRAKLIISDAIWSTLLLANYHFMQTGIDYFSRQTIPSPFQHFWSLSIEEQFYVFFPALFVFVASLHGFKVGKFSIGWRGRINLILIIFSIASFLFALKLFADNATAFYFSTPARAWQLLLGGLTYVFQTRFVFRQNRLSQMISLIFLVLTFSWVIFGGSNQVSFSVIVASSIFGATSIFLFSDPKFPGRFLLDNKLLIFMGTISYSLYLWHWPIRIFAQNWIESPLLLDVVFVSLSIGVATFSRKYIEMPFLKIKPRHDLKFSEMTIFKNLPRFNFWEIKIKAWIGLLAIFSMPGIALFTVTNVPSQTILIPINEFSSDLLTTVPNGDSTTEFITGEASIASDSYEKVLAAWSISINDGLKVKSIPPTLNPPFSKILDERGSAWNKCLFINKNTDCTFGSASSPRKVVVFGDSFAVSLIPAIRAAYGSSGVEIIGLTLNECTIADVTPWLLGKPFIDCKINRDWALNRITQINPEMLIMAENATFPISKSGARVSEGERTPLWAAGLRDTFKKLAESSIKSKIVYVGQWPIRDRSITDCVDAKLQISDFCVGKKENGSSLRRIASEMAKEFEINFVDSSRWVCSTYLCPPIISNSPVIFDNAHLTETFSTKIGPIIKSYLQSIGASV